MTDKNKISDESKSNNIKIGVIASRFNSFVVDRLLNTCLDTLKNNGLNQENIMVVRVPGAFEIPVAAQRLITAGGCDAVIALGVIIRGETPHFEYIASQCSSGLAQIALNHDTPVIFGVLTVDNSNQAIDTSMF